MSMIPENWKHSHHGLSDAHAHIGSQIEIEERINQQIPTLLCGTTPREWELILTLEEAQAPSSVLISTCGIHPWHAGKYTIHQVSSALSRCSIIGEIGMDLVWCDVPINIQEEIFIRQLQIAMEQRKPVILHTKGMEKEVAILIAQYPNQYMVHWYSAKEHLLDYINMDCYISIGPDVLWNPVVQQVARQVPIHRLLVETDGMGAVAWAFKEGKIHNKGKGNDKRNEAKTISDSIENTLGIVAGIKGETIQNLTTQVRNNFFDFCRNQEDC